VEGDNQVSRTIDERVVEMQFNNQQFEQNVHQSMGTLEKLKQLLKFDKSTTSLSNLNEASRKFDMSGISNAVSEVHAKFSALDIVGVTALANIANQAVNTGKQMLSSLTIAPISDGFKEYELKIGSVQTILAGTGESLETVNKYLEELNQYADKTIYSFSDMTSNIGKFTNAGVKLNDAVSAIKGISNLAAISGANAQQASHAMYNFSQALSSGSIKLIDWMSIKNATMDTLEFKQTLLDTAVALKTVSKNGDEYSTITANAQGKTYEAFNATKQFTDSLQAQWLTTDVLVTALNAYSTDVREMTDEQKKAYHEQLIATGYTEEQAEKLESLGQRAADAATKVRTFSQLMDTLKEAVGSGWAQTFEIIFGDFDFATKYFTKLSDFFGDFFGKQAEKRNEMLKEWADIPSIEDGARGKLFRAFARIGDRVSEYIEPIKRAWSEIMPEFTAKTLGDITFGFANKITKHMKWFESTYDRLYETSKGVFSVVKLIANVFANLGKYGIPVIQRALGVICRQLLNITGPIGKDLSKMIDGLLASGKIEKTIKGIAGSLLKFIDTVDEGITALRTKGFKGFGEWFSKLFDIKSFDPKGVFTALKNKFLDAFKDFTNTVGSLFGESNLYGKIKDGVKAFTDSFKYVFDTIANIPMISNVVSGIQNLFKPIADWFSSLLEKNGFLSNLLKFSDEAKKVSDNKTVFESFGDALRSITNGFANFGTYAKDLKDGTLKTLDNFGDKFGNFINGISGNLGKVDWVGVSAVAGQIGTMVVAFEAIATIAKAISTGKGLVEAATKTMGAIKTFFSNVNNILTKFTFTNTWVGKFKSIAKSVAILSASIFIVARAIVDLASLEPDQLDKGLQAFLAIAVVLTVMEIALSKLGNGIEVGTAVGVVAMAIALKTIVSALVDLANLVLEFEGHGELLQDAFTDLIVVIGVMLGVVAALGLIQNKIGPLGSVSGMITVVGFVLALKLLIGVLNDIAKFKIDNVLPFLGKLILVILTLDAISAIASLSSGSLSSGLGILAMVLAVKLLVSALKDIATLDVGAILGNIDALLLVAISLVTLAIILTATGKNALQAGVGILAIAVAIKLLVGVIQTIGTMNPAVAIKGVLGLTVLIIGIGVLLKAVSVASENAMKAGIAILLISIALNLLVIPVFLLGSMKASTALKGVTALLALMIGVSVMLLATRAAGQYAVQAGVAIVLITLALNGLVYAVYMLGNIQSSKLFKAIVAIGMLGLMMGALMVFSKFTDVSSWTGILAIAGAITMLSLALVALAMVPQENLENARNTIMSLGIVMMALMAVSQFTSSASAKKIILITACVTLLGALMVGIAYALKALEVDPDAMSKQFDAIMKVLLAMAAIMAVVGLFKMEPAQATAALEFIGGLTLIIGAIGGILIAINEVTGGGLADTIEKNLKVLENVGKAIGTFFHGIGEALFGGQQQSPQQVEQVKTFGDKIAELVDTLMGAADKLDGKESSLNSLKSLVGIVAEFGKAEIMDAIANFVGGGKTDLSSFGTQLSQLADGLVQFNDKLVDANIDPKVADSAVKLAKKLAELYGMDDIKSGGFIQSIIGESIGLDKLGSQLAQLATGLKQYADNLGDTNFGTDTIEKSKEMLDFLADLYGREALKSGGLIGSILGNSIGLDQLGVQLSGLAIGMSIYANTLSGVTFNEDSIKKSEDILDFIADLSGRDSLNQGGFLGMLLGNTIPFDRLGTQLAGLATGMAAYALAISKAPFDEEAAAKSNRLMQMLGTITSLNISKEGGLAGLIFGGSGLGKLATELPKLAEGVAGFVSKVQEAGITDESISMATRVTSILTSISSTANYLNNGADLTSFGTALKGFAKSIQDFLKDYTSAQESLARVNTNVFRTKFEEIMESYRMVLDELNAMPTSANVDFSGLMSSLTDAVNSISKSTGNMVKTFGDSIDSVKSTLKSNLDGLKTIVESSLSSTSESFSKAGESMANSLKTSFASGIGDFVDTVRSNMNQASEAAGGADVKAKWNANGTALAKALAAGIKSQSETVKGAGKKVAESGVTGVNSTKAKWKSAGSNLSKGLAEGIRSGRSGVINSAVSVATAAYNAAKSALKINSPSKLFIALGKGIDEGYIVGMERMAGSVEKTSTSVAQTIVSAAKSPLDNLADLMSGDIIDDPTITPVLDLSEIQNGRKQLYSMMSDADRFSLNGNISLANDASRSINRDQRRKQESENQMMGSLINAINGLSALIGNTGNVYNVNGLTYDDGSNVSSAVRSLIHAAKIGGRV
jgi:HPt (histidine-containing phosphotransfer) domain-containing protein